MNFWYFFLFSFFKNLDLWLLLQGPIIHVLLIKCGNFSLCKSDAQGGLIDTDEYSIHAGL